MHDDLVKRLRSEAVYLPEKFSKNAELLDVLMKAADAIEELSKPRWIPVTERLTECEGERVLCYCRANIYEVMKMRTDGDWVYDTNHIYMHSFVTHWMPLPQPPKEEAE